MYFYDRKRRDEDEKRSARALLRLIIDFVTAFIPPLLSTPPCPSSFLFSLSASLLYFNFLFKNIFIYSTLYSVFIVVNVVHFSFYQQQRNGSPSRVHVRSDRQSSSCSILSVFFFFLLSFVFDPLSPLLFILLFYPHRRRCMTRATFRSFVNIYGPKQYIAARPNNTGAQPKIYEYVYIRVYIYI